MITSIHIQNFILIDNLTIDFSNKLNVITGETGAGKSILINAIDIVFGAKFSNEVIKKDCDKATIELCLTCNNSRITKLFEDNFIDYTSEIIVSKEITQTSSRTRVNGTVVNQAFVKAMREIILDIHSQHQTYSFLQPKTHITLLDNYSKDIYKKLYEQYKKTYIVYTDTKRELEKVIEISNTTASQMDFLQFQIKEIEEADIVDVEEEQKLKDELTVLENAEKLEELTKTSYFSLNEESPSIIDLLLQVKKNISKAANLDNKLADTESEVVEIIELAHDVSTTLRNYSNSVSSNVERIDEIQARLQIFNKLKYKYGKDLAEIKARYENLQKELNQIEYSTKLIEELEVKTKNLSIELEKFANELSKKRKETAKELAKKIEKELEKLELEKSRFEIRITDCELSAKGKDDVEFYITTNVSQDLMPLVQSASGGEISRVMLAIKTIFAETDNIDTVIFDEIDTGISGKAAQSVSEEISELANFRQIICITHQAMIAAKADRNIFVAKEQKDKTQVKIKILDEEEKIIEIAKLASGVENEASLKFAKSLVLNNC